MYSSKSRSGRRRWTAKQRQRLLARFHESQLTQRDFANRHGVGSSIRVKELPRLASLRAKTVIRYHSLSVKGMGKSRINPECLLKRREGLPILARSVERVSLAYQGIRAFVRLDVIWIGGHGGRRCGRFAIKEFPNDFLRNTLARQINNCISTDGAGRWMLPGILKRGLDLGLRVGHCSRELRRAFGTAAPRFAAGAPCASGICRKLRATCESGHDPPDRLPLQKLFKIVV